MDNSSHGGRADPYSYGYPPPSSAPPCPYPAPADHTQPAYGAPYPPPFAYPANPPPYAHPALHSDFPSSASRPALHPDGIFQYAASPYSGVDSASAYAPPPPFAPPTYAVPSAYPLAEQLGGILLSDQTPTLSFSGKPSFHTPPEAPAPSFNGSQHGGNIPVAPSSQSSNTSQRVVLLHGSLDVWVFEARNLPNMDTFSKSVKEALGPRLTAVAEGLLTGGAFRKHKEQEAGAMTSDPYVSISVAGAVLGRTFVISNSENPVWSQHFCLPVAHHAAEVRFLVKDSDVVGSQLIGTVAIPAGDIYMGAKVEGTYPVLGSGGKPCRPGAALRLSVQYVPVGAAGVYYQGVGTAGPPLYGGVAGTYFPLRKGGKLTLYQDAHVPEGCLPAAELEHGVPFEHGKCWQDVSEAIRQAQHLVYITGWSVYHKVRLVRDGGYAGSDWTLGDLLRFKAQQGVRVLLLVWDDPSSRDILGLTTDGFMGTHDEETRRFFKHSSVQVLLCPRSAGKRHSWAKQKEVGTIYTHHQKTVIVDCDAGNNKRKIIAFVGGLDLCDGRYDTPKHPLFRTLKTLHKDDYHNPTFVGPDMSGPREPWHDLHCRIDGPAAHDVLTNFEDRWLKASKPHGIKKLKRSDDALLSIERIPDIIGVDDSLYLNDNDPETWHVQIFRSIDSNSVKGFPKDPKEATKKNLVCGKNVLIDMSIHTAYVKAIRAAQHFIYIENQYFLGSSYNWTSHKDLGANNLIPMEIALKIANKIKANERFSAYVVIPMWPEGDPKSNAMQRILYWQNKTMQMMYETIYKALVEAGLEDAYVPQDYLNFFCLGNREALEGNDDILPVPNASNASSRKSRRFMIYVHSKGMIVDDEYVIVGSANINQRSLEGTRDTEIAMGAYQPQHTWARKLSGPRGQIYGYRMSLWAEHIGALEECFTRPESLECTRRIRTLGEMNWRQFCSDEVTEMKGHLLKYPVDVDRKGKVQPLAGYECFPDVGGNICGTFLAIQENLTI